MIVCVFFGYLAEKLFLLIFPIIIFIIVTIITNYIR